MPVYAVLREQLGARLGQTVTVTYSHHRQAVTVISVDAEGFVCRVVPQLPGDEEAEFWLPFKEVIHLDTSSEPPLVS